MPCSLYTSIFCRSNSHRCIFYGTSRQPNVNQTDRGCFRACKYEKKMFGVCKRNFELSIKTQRTKCSNVSRKYFEQNHNFGIEVCTQLKCSQLHLERSPLKMLLSKSKNSIRIRPLRSIPYPQKFLRKILMFSVQSFKNARRLKKSCSLKIKAMMLRTVLFYPRYVKLCSAIYPALIGHSFPSK